MLLHMPQLSGDVAGHGGQRSPRRVCSLDEFQQAAQELGLDHGDDGIHHLLEIFSGLGAVNWFPQVAKNLVILDPQWLIDSMACLIREHEEHHSKLLEDLREDADALPLFDKAEVKCGIFPVKLLEYIWSSDKEQYKALNGRGLEVNALKKILEHFGLICRVRKHRDAKDGKQEAYECYVVPPLLPDGLLTDDYISNYLEYDNAKKFTCVCDFSESKWLQQSVFHRLVCTIVTSLRGAMRVECMQFTKRMACMYAGDAVLSLCLLDRWRIQAQTVNYEDCPHSSQWMLQLVCANMEKVLNVFREKVPYRVLVSASKDSLVKLADLKRGGNRVSIVSPTSDTTTTGAPRRVKAQPLRRIWLRSSKDVQQCKLNCLEAPSNVSLLFARLLKKQLTLVANLTPPMHILAIHTTCTT